MELKGNVHYVGVNDRNKTLFENLWPLPYGVSYNSYLIADDDAVVLVDTVDVAFFEVYLKKIRAVIGDRKIDYLIINHMEPDHSGSISLIKQYYPDIVLVGNKKTFDMVDGYYGVGGERKVVAEGDSLKVGRHDLHFYLIPMVHWPETMVTFDSTDGILFSGDAFGCFGALNGGCIDKNINTEIYMGEMRRYYSNIVGKYGPQVQNALRKISSLDIKRIAPLHGPIWRTPETIEYILHKYLHWSSYTAEQKGVVIAFGSMYGNTRAIAQQLAKQLSKRGVTDIKIYDVSKTNASYIIADAWKYTNLVTIAPTYNLNLYLTMENFIHELKALNFQNHKVSIIGNHSWASAAMKTMVAHFENDFKDIEIVSEPLDIKSSLKEEDLPLIEKMADDIKASIEAAEIKDVF